MQSMHSKMHPYSLVRRTPSGSCDNTPSKKGLRNVLETAFEKVLRRVLRRCLTLGFRGRQASEKGQEKGF